MTLKVFKYLEQNFNMILLAVAKRKKLLQCIMNKCQDMGQQIVDENGKMIRIRYGE